MKKRYVIFDVLNNKKFCSYGIHEIFLSSPEKEQLAIFDSSTQANVKAEELLGQYRHLVLEIKPIYLLV